MKKISAYVVACAIATVGFNAQAEEKIKEDYHPSVNGSPVTMMLDNMITQELGGRVVNLDIWAGEFIRHDSNIYSTRNNKVSDTIFSSAAGIFLQAAQAGVWQARIEGQVQHNNYNDHHEYNGNEGFIHAEGSAQFSPALSARAMIRYDRTYDNVKDEMTIYDLENFTTGVGVSIRPSPYMSIDADYRFFSQRREAQSLTWQEYDEHTFVVRPSYAITPNTRIYGQVGYMWANPTTHDDGNNHGYNDAESLDFAVGVSWRYQTDVKLFAEFGMSNFKFDSKGVVTDYQGGHKTRPNARVGGQLQVTEDIRVKAEFAFVNTVSAVTTNAPNSAYIDSLRLSAEVMYSPGAGRFTTRVTPFFINNTPSNTAKDCSYDESGIGIGLTYSVRDWFNTSCGYRYSRIDYTQGRGSYDRHSFAVGLALTF